MPPNCGCSPSATSTEPILAELAATMQSQASAQFEPAAEADAVHAGDDRERQQFEQFQELDTADCRLVAATLLDARGELRDVRPGREMAQPTAQNDCSAP